MTALLLEGLLLRLLLHHGLAELGSPALPACRAGAAWPAPASHGVWPCCTTKCTLAWLEASIWIWIHLAKPRGLAGSPACCSLSASIRFTLWVQLLGASGSPA